MANENKDVLRVFGLEAAIDNGALSTIRQKQIGFTTDTYRLAVRDTGDNIWLYCAKGQDQYGGNVYCDRYWFHVGDTDTYIDMELDEQSFFCGGFEMLNMQETTQNIFEINADNGDLDTIINTTVADTVFIRGSDGKVGINTNAPVQQLDINGITLVRDKLAFTQTDLNEYIDSLNDGYMDYNATTSHRFNGAPVLFTDKIYFTQTDANEYIDSLNDGYLDLNGETALRLRYGVGSTLMITMGSDLVILEDGVDIQVDTTTGSQFGTASNQKIGFLGATPISEQAFQSISGTPTQAEVEALRDLLINFGFMAAGP